MFFYVRPLCFALLFVTFPWKTFLPGSDNCLCICTFIGSIFAVLSEVQESVIIRVSRVCLHAGRANVVTQLGHIRLKNKETAMHLILCYQIYCQPWKYEPDIVHFFF